MAAMNHWSTDPFAKVSYSGDSLVITGASPGHFLVEWHKDKLVRINLVTGHAKVLSDPEDIAAIWRFLEMAPEARAAYLPAKAIRKATGMTHKQLLAFLRKHPSIRVKRPSRQRLYIHAHDFVACYPWPDYQSLYLAGVELRKEAEHRRKIQGRA
jgi:hypothetical protein